MSDGRRRRLALDTLLSLGSVWLLLAPVLVTVALKVNALLGIERAPQSLGLGSRRIRHRRRSPLQRRAGDRNSRPRHHRRQLQPALRGRWSQCHPRRHRDPASETGSLKRRDRLIHPRPVGVRTPLIRR